MRCVCLKTSPVVSAVQVGETARQSLKNVGVLEFRPADHTEGFSFRTIAFSCKPNDVKFAGVSRCPRYLLDLSRLFLFH